jgi:hypothetical protein
MKIALCLSGQPRSYTKAYEYLNENLFSRFDVDVFMHTWYYDFFDYNSLLALYEPKKVKIEHKLKCELDESRRYSKYNVYSSLHSIKQSSILFESYEAENKFTYDWVIRSRFDFALNLIPDFNSFDKKRIYAPPSVREEIINDQFCICSSENMKIYSDAITNLDQLLSSGVSFSAEDLVSSNLRLHGLYENVELLNVNPPFSPGSFDSMPHSMIRDDFNFWSNK